MSREEKWTSFFLFLVSLPFFHVFFSPLLFNFIFLSPLFLYHISSFPSLSVSLINYIKYLMKSFHHHYHYRVEREEERKNLEEREGERRRKGARKRKWEKIMREKRITFFPSSSFWRIEKNSFNSFFSSFDDLSQLFHSFPLFLFLSPILSFSLPLSLTIIIFPLSLFLDSVFVSFFFVTNNLILSLLH